jgi:hypothetical protein
MLQGLSLKNSIEIKYDKEYLYDRLERLFFVSNEIPGRLNEGSQIMDFFWEPADETTIQRIIFEIKRLIYKYERNLGVNSISAGFIPTTDKELMLVIEIEYSLKVSPDKKENLSFIKIRNKEQIDE